MKIFQYYIALLFITGIAVLTVYSQPSDKQQDVGSSQPARKISFEGSIQFVQETVSDTSYYTYHVKGRMVRMDIHSECDNCEEEENRLLFDLDAGTITALHPKRKLYMNISVKPYMELQDSNFRIMQTRNNKNILGMKCYQWRVKNKDQNTEIAYWVANDNFDFFIDFLKLWNRSEKHAVYYLRIPDAIGFFPLLSVERTTLRDEKMRLQVVQIEKAELNKSMFEIPKDYKHYDR